MRNKNIDEILNFLLLLMILVVPVLIEIDANKYNRLKYGALLIIGVSIFVTVIIKLLTLKSNNKIDKIDNIDVKDVLIFLFCGLILISALFSSNIKKSFIGENNRYEGVFTLCIYFLIYFISKKTIKRSNFRKIFNIFIAIYIFNGMLGIMQNYISIPNRTCIPIFDKGVCGTFGNRNFMGSFLSLGIPLFVITYIIYNNKLSFITAILTFHCILGCSTRSTWIAFSVSCILIGMYLLKNRRKEYILRAILLSIIFIIIFLLMLFFNNNDFYKRIEALSQNSVTIVDEKGINNKLGSGRIGIWKICIELTKKYPLLGVGPDNLGDSIEKNITEKSKYYSIVKKLYVDKAHNEFLHIVVTIGIPALITYLIFLFKIINPKLKTFFRDTNTFILLCMIISYLIQAFFNISTIGVAPLFWMLLGICDNKNT